MDEVDRAQKITDQALEIALDHQRNKSRLPETGRCHWCDEEIATGFFCDQDCRDDFEKQQRFRAVR